ncbi:hypothetical protein FQA47_000541 [Oryzias melastigma]|uniref:Uncharacterized protein n=1 Tax=Oryzias melastigma TaxID=30732 RepID=A0A834FQM7_ORYME|nr:hypothetical protein FQA47_000541 [Oryzias melastigma]
MSYLQRRAALVLRVEVTPTAQQGEPSLAAFQSRRFYELIRKSWRTDVFSLQRNLSYCWSRFQLVLTAVCRLSRFLLQHTELLFYPAARSHTPS